MHVVVLLLQHRLNLSPHIECHIVCLSVSSDDKLDVLVYLVGVITLHWLSKVVNSSFVVEICFDGDCRSWIKRQKGLGCCRVYVGSAQLNVHFANIPCVCVEIVRFSVVGETWGRAYCALLQCVLVYSRNMIVAKPT